MIEIELDLPLPPSVNEIWRGGRGRQQLQHWHLYQSDAYKRWQREADKIVLGQRHWRNKKIPQRFTALLILNENMLPPNADGDNRLKVPLDYAKRLGLIIDDSIRYCRGGAWILGTAENAPHGARLILHELS